MTTTMPMPLPQKAPVNCPHCGQDIEDDDADARSLAEARASADQLLNHTGKFPFNIKLPLVYNPEIKLSREFADGRHEIKFRGGIWLNDFIDEVDNCHDRIAPDDYADMTALCSMLLEKKAEADANGDDDMIVGFRKTIVIHADMQAKRQVRVSVSVDFY